MTHGQIVGSTMNEISELIESAGMPMTEISKRYGIPYRTLQNWKSGVRIPPPYVTKMLSEILKKSPDA